MIRMADTATSAEDAATVAVGSACAADRGVGDGEVGAGPAD